MNNSISIRWQSLPDSRIETLALHIGPEAIIAQSRIRGDLAGELVDLDYVLTLAPDWTWTHFLLEMGGAELCRLTRGANAGLSAPFIDFVLTPLTNSLPIRKLNLHPGETAVIETVYLDYPVLETTVDRQEYTRIDQWHYRFRQLSTGFEAVIAVDETGLVTDYPGLFRRID